MDRRTYLRVAGTASIAGIAGCGALGSGGVTTGTPDPWVSEDTYLTPPDRSGPPDAYPHPVHGDTLPEVTVPAPLHDTEITTTQFDTPTFVTFFYSNCMTVCPVLISALRNTQAKVGTDGHAAAVTFLPISFDPARDTEQALDEYADRMNVDRDADNWYFLRPEDEQRARAVVDDTFGVFFQQTTPQDMDRYMFTHTGVILLANSDNVVERAYRDVDSWKPLYQDYQTLRGTDV